VVVLQSTNRLGTNAFSMHSLYLDDVNELVIFLRHFVFLFQPNFGASLQILKVEIGGDAQTTGWRISEQLSLVFI